MSRAEPILAFLPCLAPASARPLASSVCSETPASIPSAVTASAKGSNPGGLQAVGELKEAGDEEERNRRRNDVRLIGQHAGEERRI